MALEHQDLRLLCAVSEGCELSYLYRPVGQGPWKAVRGLIPDPYKGVVVLSRRLRNGAREDATYSFPAHGYEYDEVSVYDEDQNRQHYLTVGAASPDPNRPTRSEEQRAELLRSQQAAAQEAAAQRQTLAEMLVAQEARASAERAAQSQLAEQQRKVLADMISEQEKRAEQQRLQLAQQLAQLTATAPTATLDLTPIVQILQQQQQQLAQLQTTQQQAQPHPFPAQAPLDVNASTNGTDVAAALLAVAAALQPPPKERAEDRGFSPECIASWGPFIEAHTIVLWEISMRQAFACPTQVAKDDLEQLFLAARAYFVDEGYEWPMPSRSAALFESLLRRARISSAGVAPSQVAQLMTKTDFKFDPLGAALASAKRTPGGKRTGGSKITCWYCSKVGHSAHACKQRIAAGDPIPTAPPAGDKAPDTVVGRKQKKGGDKGSD